jgi:hypothetical protein
VMLHIEPISLEAKRSFSWRALLILFGLYLLGSAASIPLLVDRGLLTETPREIVIAVLLTLAGNGAGLWFASRTGLGAPLIEGVLPRERRARWLRQVVAIGVLCGVVGGFLAAFGDYIRPWRTNAAELAAWAARLPALWKLLLASIDAGVQEELFSRLFLMSLFAWLGGLFWHDEEGRPVVGVFVAAIALSGMLFGLAHIDEELQAGIALRPLIRIFILTSLLGGLFGWLYWKLGLEAAMLTHFLIDAFASTLFVPVFLSGSVAIVIAAVVGGSALAAACIQALASGEGESGDRNQVSAR